MYEVVLRDSIWAEGRGPELRSARYRSNGLGLVALEYLNPDWTSEADLRHLVIHQAQVHMFTPHEVYNFARDEVRWGPPIDQAAVVNLGKSEWLLTFSQQRLARCSHYRIMFYDEYLDLICENISVESGPYRAQTERTSL
jgi:hypothetical protein